MVAIRYRLHQVGEPLGAYQKGNSRRLIAVGRDIAGGLEIAYANELVAEMNSEDDEAAVP